MARVRVESEAETDHGWEFRVLLEGAPGAPVSRSNGGPGGGGRILIVSLAWVDYSYWSPTGASSPEKIAAKVTQYVAENWNRRHGAPAPRPDGRVREAHIDLPERFDAATARRWFPELDEVLQGTL